MRAAPPDLLATIGRDAGLVAPPAAVLIYYPPRFLRMVFDWRMIHAALPCGLRKVDEADIGLIADRLDDGFYERFIFVPTSPAVAAALIEAVTTE